MTHRSLTPFLSTYNGPSYLLHTVEVLSALGVSLRQTRLLPDIGRVAEPETCTYDVTPFTEGGWPGGSEATPVYFAVNVREDNRLHRFLPLLAVGLPPLEAVAAWREGRAAPNTPLPDDFKPPPYALLEGFHRFYLEPDAMPRDWTNRINPAERLALQLCERFRELRDPGTLPDRVAERMLIAVRGRYEERDNPLAGTLRYSDDPGVILATQSGTVLELMEVFLTQAMLTIAGADLLGGFEFVLPFEPPEGRPLAFPIDRGADASTVSRWFNAYPRHAIRDMRDHFDSRRELERPPSPPPHWSENDPAILKAAKRIADWYAYGQHEESPWQETGRRRQKYKLENEAVTPGEMLSIARDLLPDFLPDYPTQVNVTGGLNMEGILLGLMARWLEQGTFLGMDYADWSQFTLSEQAILCGLLTQRRLQTDQCAIFEAAVRLLIDENVKTWIESYRREKVALGTPLAQLGRSLPLGGYAALHAPGMMIRIPRDRTRDPDADRIEAKLTILERLFLPAHIPPRHIWEIDWVYLGQTAYLNREVNPVNPDLIPDGVRLYGADEKADY